MDIFWNNPTCVSSFGTSKLSQIASVFSLVNCLKCLGLLYNFSQVVGNMFTA